MTDKHTHAEKRDWIWSKTNICFYVNLSQIKLYCVQLAYIAKQHIFIYCTHFSFSKLNNNLPREAFQFFFSYPNLNLSRVRKWDIQYSDSPGSRLIRRSFQFIQSASTIFRERFLAPILVSELFQQSLFIYTHIVLFKTSSQLEWFKPLFSTPLKCSFLLGHENYTRERTEYSKKALRTI